VWQKTLGSKVVLEVCGKNLISVLQSQKNSSSIVIQNFLFVCKFSQSEIVKIYSKEAITHSLKTLFISLT